MISDKAKSMIDRYERASKMGISLVNMDPSTLAGYYLKEYSDPLAAIVMDIRLNRIPSTSGQAAKVIILTIIEHGGVL